MDFYINTETQEYPVMEGFIRSLYPNTSFPSPFKPPAPFVKVYQTVIPTVDVLKKPVEGSPELVDGIYYKTWQIVDKYSDYTDEEGVFHTKAEQEAAALQRYKQTKLDTLTAKRYTEETKGLTFNGLSVPTDRSSQAMLTGAYNTMQQNPDRIINWKTDNGFIQLNKDAIDALSLAVADHIQDCFDREMVLAAAIELDTETDITEGWPV